MPDIYANLLAQVTTHLPNTGQMDPWRDRIIDAYRVASIIMRERRDDPSLRRLVDTATFDAMRDAVTDGALSQDLRAEVSNLIENTPGMDGIEIRPGRERDVRDHWGYMTMLVTRIPSGASI
jgi:hypothetical protein